jgi:DNA-binding NarL/FixJ family response regulator
MLASDIQGYEPVASKRILGAKGSVLVVGDGPLEAITEALRARKLTITTFDDVEALIEDASAPAHTTVLIWAQDTGPSLPRAIESLKRGVEQAKVIVLCVAIKGWEVHCALAAGALGIVLEDDLAHALGPCLEAVAAGQVCVPQSHWRQVETPALSMREKQILGLVVMGYMNGQIAEQLFLAESTVKSHLSSAFAKLGVRSRHEAVSLIVDPQRGLGMGILGLGGERIEMSSPGESS